MTDTTLVPQSLDARLVVATITGNHIMAWYLMGGGLRIRRWGYKTTWIHESNSAPHCRLRNSRSRFKVYRGKDAAKRARAAQRRSGGRLLLVTKKAHAFNGGAKEVHSG